MGISNVILLPSRLALVWYVLVIVGGFKMFKKANKPAILAIIPVVNFFVLVDAVTDGTWYKGFWMLWKHCLPVRSSEIFSNHEYPSIFSLFYSYFYYNTLRLFFLTTHSTLLTEN